MPSKDLEEEAQPRADDPWARIRALPLHALEVVTKIKENGRIERHQAVAIAEKHGRSFPRTMESIKKAIGDAGLRENDVFVTEAKGFGADKVTYYVAGKALLASQL